MGSSVGTVGRAWVVVAETDADVVVEVVVELACARLLLASPVVSLALNAGAESMFPMFEWRLCKCQSEPSEINWCKTSDEPSATKSNAAGCDMYLVEAVMKMRTSGIIRTVHRVLRPTIFLSSTTTGMATGAFLTAFSSVRRGGRGEGGGVNMSCGQEWVLKNGVKRVCEGRESKVILGTRLPAGISYKMSAQEKTLTCTASFESSTTKLEGQNWSFW